MSSWLLKTALQHVFGALPRSEWWNGLMQRYVTRGLRLEAYGEFQSKVRAGHCHFRNYHEFTDQPQQNFAVIEVGTGWFPIIPIALHLCGAGQIWTYDIVRLLRTDTFQRVLEHFRWFATTGKLYEVLPDAQSDRVSNFLSLARSPSPPVEFLKHININAIIGDVSHLPFDRGSVDFIFPTEYSSILPRLYLRRQQRSFVEFATARRL